MWLFRSSLLQGVNLDRAFSRVTDAVKADAKGQQVPAKYDAGWGEAAQDAVLF